jgi:hypothetical protein
VREINKALSRLDMMTHICNPSTWEAEAEDYMFEASLSYIVRCSLKTKPKETNKKLYLEQKERSQI